jgi:hypothetical protein
LAAVLQLLVRHDPLELAVLPLEILQPRASSAFMPPNWFRHP